MPTYSLTNWTGKEVVEGWEEALMRTAFYRCTKTRMGGNFVFSFFLVCTRCGKWLVYFALLRRRGCVAGIVRRGIGTGTGLIETWAGNCTYTTCINDTKILNITLLSFYYWILAQFLNGIKSCAICFLRDSIK